MVLIRNVREFSNLRLNLAKVSRLEFTFQFRIDEVGMYILTYLLGRSRSYCESNTNVRIKRHVNSNYFCRCYSYLCTKLWVENRTNINVNVKCLFMFITPFCCNTLFIRCVCIYIYVFTIIFYSTYLRIIAPTVLVLCITQR